MVDLNLTSCDDTSIPKYVYARCKGTVTARARPARRPRAPPRAGRVKLVPSHSLSSGDGEARQLPSLSRGSGDAHGHFPWQQLPTTTKNAVEIQMQQNGMCVAADAMLVVATATCGKKGAQVVPPGQGWTWTAKKQLQSLTWPIKCLGDGSAPGPAPPPPLAADEGQVWARPLKSADTGAINLRLLSCCR